MASFTRVRVRETVPDRILEMAEIEVVDIPPDELIERLKAGKVYLPHEATRALSHFFSKSYLSALRELALRRAAQAVDAQMLDHIRAAVATVPATSMVAGIRAFLTDARATQLVVGKAANRADAAGAEFTLIFPADLIVRTTPESAV